MTLYEQIREDMKSAMKRHDSATLDTIRMLISSIKNKMIEAGTVASQEIADADVMGVIKSDVKKLKDGLESFVVAAREDLADAARREIAILEKYLPAQITDGELEEKVRAELASLGITSAADLGKAMGTLMGKLKDMADGSRIKQMVDKVLKA